jgi:hypothetical protein
LMMRVQTSETQQGDKPIPPSPHVAPEVPHELTQTPPLLHAPEQHDALVVQGEAIAMHAPPPPLSTGGGEPASGVVTGQQAWLDWPQLSRQFPPQPFGTQHTPFVQTWPAGHDGQRIVAPQLFVTDTWH